MRICYNLLRNEWNKQANKRENVKGSGKKVQLSHVRDIDSSSIELETRMVDKWYAS